MDFFLEWGNVLKLVVVMAHSSEFTKKHWIVYLKKTFVEGNKK